MTRESWGIFSNLLRIHATRNALFIQKTTTIFGASITVESFGSSGIDIATSGGWDIFSVTYIASIIGHQDPSLHRIPAFIGGNIAILGNGAILIANMPIERLTQLSQFQTIPFDYLIGVFKLEKWLETTVGYSSLLHFCIGTLLESHFTLPVLKA